jgi:hypothetical protein
MPDVLANALGTIPILRAAVPGFEEPFLAPTIDGYVQLEWHGSPRTLELEATPDGWSMVGSEVTLRGEHTYYEAESTSFDVDRLVAAYRWYARLELIWPII